MNHPAAFRPNKALGQHFLRDADILARIVERAAVQPGETVLEIGPGEGVLSKELLAVAGETGRVVAVEYDPRAQAYLAEHYPTLEVVGGDALRVLPDVLKTLASYKVVANIPYQITSPLIRLFLDPTAWSLPDSLTLLVQHEVAERLTATPGGRERSFLSVLCEYFCETEYSFQVPPAAFYPPPKVVSAVVFLKTRASRALPSEQEADFVKFVRRYFTQPRKQFRNVMAGIRGVKPAVIGDYFDRLGFPANVRAEELSLADWIRLYQEPYA